MNPSSHGFGAIFLDLLQTIVLALAIFMLTYLLLVQPNEVKGNSMHPNFVDRERLLTEKVTYRFSNPQRGDVIVFEAPPDRQKDFIKRVIALPGETIEIKDNRVYINKQILDESYLDSSVLTHSGAYLSESRAVTLGDNEYFVMGDNRDHSSDSRSWGTITRDKIVGKAWFVYWPLQKLSLIQIPSYAGI